MRAPAGVATRVIGKARDFVAESETLAQKYGKAEGIKDSSGNTIEPTEWAVAQVKALLDPKDPKRAVWFPAGTLTQEQQVANVRDAIIGAGKKGNIEEPIATDQGILILNDAKANKAFNKLVRRRMKEEGATDKTIQDILEYGEEQKGSDPYVVVVRDKNGNPIDYQSVSEENADATKASVEAKRPNQTVTIESKEEFTQEKVDANLYPKAKAKPKAPAKVTVPKNIKVGDTIELFDATGKPYTTTVTARSKQGSLKVKNEAGKDVLIGDVSAVLENTKSPEYQIESIGPKIREATKGKKSIDELTSKELDATEVVLKELYNDGKNNNQGSGQAALKDLNAIKNKRKRTKKKSPKKKKQLKQLKKNL